MLLYKDKKKIKSNEKQEVIWCIGRAMLLLISWEVSGAGESDNKTQPNFIPKWRQLSSMVRS